MPSLANMKGKAKEAGLMKLDKLIANRQRIPNCEIAYDVLLRAEGIERNEVDIFSWVRQGDTISEIIDKGGYF